MQDDGRTLQDFMPGATGATTTGDGGIAREGEALPEGAQVATSAGSRSNSSSSRPGPGTACRTTLSLCWICFSLRLHY